MTPEGWQVMDARDERDYAEEEYWRYACPECESDVRDGHTHSEDEE